MIARRGSDDAGEAVQGLADDVEELVVPVGEAAAAEPGDCRAGHAHGRGEDRRALRKGQVTAAGGDDQTITIWDLRTGQELQTLQPNAGTILAVEFSPDGERLAAGSTSGGVTLWDSRTLTPDVRVELLAADLLADLLPQASSDDELRHLIHERASLDEAVRHRALEMTHADWKARASAKIAAKKSP